jgi:hypothetical protein
MSSTNRNNTRHGADYYVTPIAAVLDFFKAWDNPSALAGSILDPCAGGDDSNPMSYPEAINIIRKRTTGFTTTEIGQTLLTLDIRPDSSAAHVADYMTWQPYQKYGLIITNPPFNIALDIIKKARQEITDDGYVVMLLRLNFLGGKERGRWMRQNMPESIWVHSQRMKFLNTSGTDSIEYAHFVWRKNHCETTIIKLIGD